MELTNRQVKYSPISVPLITLGLSALCVIFFSILVNAKSFGAGEIFMLFATILFSFILLMWTILFFIPLILGRPALILNDETLYVASINQNIPWKEIQQMKITNNRNNTIISMIVSDKDRTFIRPTNFFKNFICISNTLYNSTPFGFWTMPLQGRSQDIYTAIKNSQTINKLNP